MGRNQPSCPWLQGLLCFLLCCAPWGWENKRPLQIPWDGQSPPFFPSSCTEPLPRPLYPPCRAPTLRSPPTPLASSPLDLHTPTPHLLLSTLFITLLFVYGSFCLCEDPSAQSWCGRQTHCGRNRHQRNPSAQGTLGSRLMSSPASQINKPFSGRTPGLRVLFSLLLRPTPAHDGSDMPAR